MGKRLLPILAWLALGMPAAAWALGLGNITMNSALNQPLDAEIELLDVKAGDLDNLTVRLGSQEDFDRVGAERSFFLTKLNFTLEKTAGGTSYIKVTSTQTVTEPFLDFVIEARWPRGRVLREFTVLVDPPVLVAEGPAPVQQPAVSTKAVVTAEATERSIDDEAFFRSRSYVGSGDTAAPAAPARERVAGRATLAPVESKPGELTYGPVKPSDTLWQIASDLRPADVSVSQMMLALVKQNPQAFYHANSNEMKAGYVLRIKDRNALSAVGVAAADAEIIRQRNEWQARKSGTLVAQAEAPVSGQVLRGGAPAGGAGDGAAQARLKLVAPGAEGAGSGADEVKQLREDLLLAAEALDANRQETEDLKKRLTEMQEQMTAMERLLTLKDTEMAALQRQLGGTKPAAPAQPVAGEAAAPAAAEAPTTEAAPAAQQPAAPKPKAKAKPAPVEEEPGLVDQILSSVKGVVGDPLALLGNTYVLYGVVAVIVAGLLGALVMRRRKMKGGFEESILNVGTAAAGGAEAGGTPSFGGSSMVSDFAMSEMSDMSGIQAEAAEVDPISEADVYLAYGRHQQAEDIIRDALKKTPDRHELKLKLLEIHFAAKNREAFEREAQEFHTALGDESNPMWARVVTMGRQLCPGNELFGGVSADSLKRELASDTAASDEDLLDFDFDLDTGAGADTKRAVESDGGIEIGAGAGAESDAVAMVAEHLVEEEEPAPARAKSNDEYNLDYDIAPVNKPETTTAAAPGSSSASLDFDVSSLDFDLDTGEPATEELAASGLEFDLGDKGKGKAGETLAGLDDGLEFDLGETVLEEAAPIDLDIEPGELGLEQPAAALGDELGADVFAEVDEVGTKLDLARAYVDMGDEEGARNILSEVMEEGNDDQKSQAQKLLAQMG